MTPYEQARKDTRERINRMLAAPELRPLSPEALKGLKINSQPVKVVFETIGKTAGINVLWDPEYQQPQRNTLNIEFDNTTLEEALDYVSVITKSYWKALSPNTIFITNDNPTKRRDFADMVAKTFYLQNINTAQEIQEIVNALRTLTELQRVVAYPSQNAVLIRGELDQVALAEKMLMDLDKPRAEVVVDIMVVEASSVFSRQLTAAIASTGLTIPVNFTPRASIATPALGTSTPSTGDGSTPAPATPAAIPTIPLSHIGKVNAGDFTMTLPSGLLQAVLSDTKTKVVQAPQIRAIDNVKASLKIGERQPTATGSFQPGIGGVGINPLVNTQFNYLDVGVNVELQPRVHDNGDVSMHIDLDISSVTGHVNLGGIDQPIIGQRKISHDVRMHEGEVNLLGGLINQQESKQITGIPGLNSIPLLRRLFSGESTDASRGELMIVLIPHIVRRQEITSENLKGILVGNQTAVKINYGPKPDDTPKSAAPMAQAPVTTPAPGAPQAAVPVNPQPNPPATVAPVPPPPASTPAVSPGLAPPATAPPIPGVAPPVPAPPPPAADASTLDRSPMRVNFSPLQIEVNQGSSFTVSLSVDAGTDVSSAPMQIQFDPKVLRLDTVARGPFLSSDGQNPSFTRDVRNEQGVATVQLGRQPGSPGVTGGGALVTLTFQAIARGATTVTAPNLTVRDSKGAVLVTTTPQLGVTIK
jgi:general secretion pathway protein D